MIRGFWRWMRVISPAETVVGIAVGTSLTIAALTSLLIHVVLPILSIERPNIDQRLVILPVALLSCLGAIAYGGMRVVYFHPIAWPDYRRWLMSTPWQPQKPLPLGPVRLMPQDAIWMLVFTSLVAPTGSEILLAMPALLALISYLLVSAWFLHHGGPYWAAYAIAILAFVLLNLAGRAAIEPGLDFRTVAAER